METTTYRIYEALESGPKTAVEVWQIMGNTTLGTVRASLEKMVDREVLHKHAIKRNSRRTNLYAIQDEFSGYKYRDTYGGNETGNPLKHGERELPIDVLQAMFGSGKVQDYIEETDGYLTTPCWNWTRSKSKGGYPQMLIRHHIVRLHRVALTVKLDRYINPSMTASHLCHNPSCINPDHLVEESIGDNNHRKVRRAA